MPVRYGLLARGARGGGGGGGGGGEAGYMWRGRVRVLHGCRAYIASGRSGPRPATLPLFWHLVSSARLGQAAAPINCKVCFWSACILCVTPRARGTPPANYRQEHPAVPLIFCRSRRCHLFLGLGAGCAVACGFAVQWLGFLYPLGPAQDAACFLCNPLEVLQTVSLCACLHAVLYLLGRASV